MKSLRCCHLVLIALVALLSGCAKKESAGDNNQDSEMVGITFKGGKGLRIADETKKIIGLEVVEASEQKITPEFSASFQIYRDAEGRAEATGFVTAEQAGQIKTGQSVALQWEEASTNKLQGKVLRLLPPASSGQTEVLLEVPDAGPPFEIGTTLEAVFTAQSAQSVTAIPRSAVLQTTEGTFAYVVNGDYFFRTAIKTGAENADFVEIKDGLYTGDQIVKQPVMTLWIAELHAIKGGADND